MKFFTMMVMSGLISASGALGASVFAISGSNPQSISNSVCLSVLSPNLIKNGNFQTNGCVGAVCFWDQNNFASTNVPGWLPNPDIGVGQASLFNSNRSPETNFVAQLDPDSNTCIKQNLTMKRGTYNLSFNWAAKEKQSLDTSKVIIKVNGRILEQLPKALDYQIQTTNTLFNIKYEVPNGSIELCGGGLSDGKGATVDNVVLTTISDCS